MSDNNFNLIKHMQNNKKVDFVDIGIFIPLEEWLDGFFSAQERQVEEYYKNPEYWKKDFLYKSVTGDYCSWPKHEICVQKVTQKEALRIIEDMKKNAEKQNPREIFIELQILDYEKIINYLKQN